MKESPLHKNDKLSERGNLNSLILFNDDFNTFDHVITSLVEVCGHDPVQAEQCALIVHLRGKYEVKIGRKAILNRMCKDLIGRGLDAIVESL